MSVCTPVRPSTESFLDFNEIWHVGRGRKSLKVGNPSIFQSYLLRHLQWELTTDHWFLNYGTISKFDWAEFLIFVIVFVSRDFQLGRNVSCEESTVSPARG